MNQFIHVFLPHNRWNSKFLSAKMMTRTQTARLQREVQTSSLKSATYANSEQFVLRITEGFVVKVYDGDTVTIAFENRPILQLWKRNSTGFRFALMVLIAQKCVPTRWTHSKKLPKSNVRILRSNELRTLCWTKWSSLRVLGIINTVGCLPKCISAGSVLVIFCWRRDLQFLMAVLPKCAQITGCSFTPTHKSACRQASSYAETAGVVPVN